MVTGWLEEAADQAMKLAEELCDVQRGHEAGLKERAAVHLTYMAGLIRSLETVTTEVTEKAREQRKALLERLQRYEAKAKADMERQRNELLTAARQFVKADDSVSDRYALELADVVARIEKEIAGP